MLESLQRAAKEWDLGDRRDDLLVHRGTRLEDAEALAATPHFVSDGSTERQYLNACRAAQSAREAVPKLIAQAQGMLAGTTAGGDVRALQQILAAHWLAKDDATDGALYTAVAQRASTLKIITGHTSAVNGVAFSHDGTRLATASYDATVRLWPGYASPDMLCAKQTTNMSQQQWRDWVSPDIDYVTLCPYLPTP